MTNVVFVVVRELAGPTDIWTQICDSSWIIASIKTYWISRNKELVAILLQFLFNNMSENVWHNCISSEQLMQKDIIAMEL